MPGFWNKSRGVPLNYQQPQSIEPSHLQELNNLSQRLKALQNETVSITTGINARRSFPHQGPLPGAGNMHIPPVQQAGIPQRTNIPPLHQPRSYIPPPAPSIQPSSLMASGPVDLDALLNEGRNARARASTIPQDPIFMANQARSSSVPPGHVPFASTTSPRAPSPMPGMSQDFLDRLNAERSGAAAAPQSFHLPQGMGAPVSDPFMGAAPAMSPINAFNEYGLASPRNAMGAGPQTAFQQYQARPADPFASTGTSGFQFPNAFNAVGPQGLHPSAMPGFAMQGYPSYNSMHLASMMDQRPMSPNPALYGF